MNAQSAAAAALVTLCLATPAFAHRLDEYLQAATIDVKKDRVVVQLRLTPGVETARTVLANIDTDADGLISKVEQRAYAERILHDLSLTVDAEPAKLGLVSSTFPKVEQMKQGLGDIALAFDAQVPPGGTHRKLVFENHHQREVGAYLVNCLLPSDSDIHVAAQNRNADQSFYQLDYTQAGVRMRSFPTASWSTWQLWVGANALILCAWLATALRRRWRTIAKDASAQP